MRANGLTSWSLNLLSHKVSTWVDIQVFTITSMIPHRKDQFTYLASLLPCWGQALFNLPLLPEAWQTVGTFHVHLTVSKWKVICVIAAESHSKWPKATTVQFPETLTKQAMVQGGSVELRSAPSLVSSHCKVLFGVSFYSRLSECMAQHREVTGMPVLCHVCSLGRHLFSPKGSSLSCITVSYLGRCRQVAGGWLLW